jgi:hypothetical protein
MNARYSYVVAAPPVREGRWEHSPTDAAYDVEDSEMVTSSTKGRYRTVAHCDDLASAKLIVDALNMFTDEPCLYCNGRHPAQLCHLIHDEEPTTVANTIEVKSNVIQHLRPDT